MSVNQTSHLKAVPKNYSAAPSIDKLAAYIHVNRLGLQINQQTIFEPLTLPVYTNHINALIGPSGCGKSSLLNTIIRLTDYEKNTRIDGSVFVDKQNIFHKNTDLIELRKKVGMIFQKPVPFPMSIRKNFELPLKEHGIKHKSDIEAHMETALKAVGLWQEVADRLNHSASMLSGGQQQRLCIARVLALKPKALLLDEPCSALDPIASRIIEELLQELKTQYTILIVTHNLSQARRIADYVAFMWYHDKHGKLIEHNRADVIFENPSNPITAAYVQGLTD